MVLHLKRAGGEGSARLAGKSLRFETAILPNLDAAYNLARWLMRNDHDAEDAVQDACVRALRAIDSLRGLDGRVWLLAIVRNVCFTRLAQGGRQRERETEFDEAEIVPDSPAADPEAIMLRGRDRAALSRALEELPDEFREVVVMRDLEGLSYKEIADVARVPIGTVMSRLARARKRLQRALGAPMPKEPS